MSRDGVSPASPEPPLAVRRAVRMSFVTAAVTVASIPLVFTSLDSARAVAVAQGQTGAAAVTATIAGAVVYGLLAGGLWVLFGVYTGRGRPWARLGLLCLAALTAISGLASLTVLGPANVGRVVDLVLAVLVASLLLTYPARAWFVQIRADRAERSGRA